MTQVKTTKEHIVVYTICNHLFIRERKGIYKNTFATQEKVTRVPSGNVATQ